MFKLRSSNWSVCVPVNRHFNHTDNILAVPTSAWFSSMPNRNSSSFCKKKKRGGRLLRRADLQNPLMNYWKCNYVGCVRYVCRVIITRAGCNYSSLNLTGGREINLLFSAGCRFPLSPFKVFNCTFFGEEGSNYCTYCMPTYCLWLRATRVMRKSNNK